MKDSSAKMQQMPQQMSKSYVEVKPKTDSYIQVISNLPWWWIGLGVSSIVIGLAVIAIVLAKITPMGQLLTKVWKGLEAMFDALIKWNPKK